MTIIDKNTLEFTSGKPFPLGCSPSDQGINLAVFSNHAGIMNLILYTNDPDQSLISVSLDPQKNRTKHIWHIEIKGLPEKFEYGYQLSNDNHSSISNDKISTIAILMDPYARAFSGKDTWGKRISDQPGTNIYRSLYVEDPFDWEGDRPLNIPLTDTIIYELHVRGYTKHSSSEVNAPGTYSGLIEKIPYLKSLGITAIELLPINEFDETGIQRTNPLTGEQLLNFWGYDPLGYFAPKASFAAQSLHGAYINEFKQLVKAMHGAGIEVILDIVFNHTGEGSRDHPSFSYRGLADSTYYMIDKNSGHYYNFTGCGNTVNCNHPVVRKMILDVLRYWVTDMHVDGFRFDLASILSRADDGSVLENPPVIEEISHDPVLSKTKLIAEAWDAAGLYQVGTFSGGRRWAIWNDKFRDTIRRYVRGDSGLIPDLATRIAGSADLFRHMNRSPYHSINYITAHDGFPLADMVSYNKKHNRMNGEGNADGMNENYSANYGHEGSVTDSEINAIRRKQMKNMAALLFLSQGVPMMLAGDEMGRTQGGNNNAYCQDNEVSWVDWDLVHQNSELLRFFKILIQFRKDHPALRRQSFFEDNRMKDNEIHWYNNILNPPNWSGNLHFLAFHLLPTHGDTDIFVITNSGKKRRKFHLPDLAEEKKWYLVMDTDQTSPADILEKDREILLPNQDYFQTEAQSTVLLLGQ
jgi:glycogen operon protein